MGGAEESTFDEDGLTGKGFEKGKTTQEILGLNDKMFDVFLGALFELTNAA